MYSGELEVQAKRKAIAVLQDEINRILNASRELATLTEALMKKDKKAIKNTLEQISTIEEEVENLRRKITREVADVGGLIMNRENLLNTAYTMDEIAGYITGIAFKLSNVKITTLKSSKLDKDITELISLVVDEVYKLNEIIRSLNTNTANAIELAQETQTIEREMVIEVDNKKAGKSTAIGMPIKFSKSKTEKSKGAPNLGEHTKEIMKIFDYNDKQIDDFYNRKIII